MKNRFVGNEEEVYDDEFDNNDDYDEYEDNESIAADDINVTNI
jgi:RNA polymerase sigma-54 factor